jgi:hypothetical protein
MKWSKGKGKGVSNGRGSGCAPHVQRDLVASRRDSPHVLPCHALVPATVSTRLVSVLHFDYEAMCVLVQRRVFPHGAADADAERAGLALVDSCGSDPRIRCLENGRRTLEPTCRSQFLPVPPPSRPRTDTASAEEL